MSELSGALTDFPLRQVLDLVAAGSKTGILVVNTEEVRGSVFFHEGRLTFATTRSGGDAADDRTGERRLPADADPVRIVSNVLMRLLRFEEGTFVFQSGVEPVHPTDGTFDVAEMVEQAESLGAEWDEIERAIGSMRQRHGLLPTFESTSEVVLSPGEWNVLATIGAGSSAAEIAERAALPEFDVASTVATLIQRKLIGPVEEPEPLEPTAPADTPDVSEQATGESETSDEQPSLVERFERYVHSRSSTRGEPPESGVVLDLTDSVLTPQPVAAAAAEEDDAPPVSELARRWRELRHGRREDEEE